LLTKALLQIKALVKYDPELEGIYDRLEPASYIMDEASREIDRYMDQLESSPARLEEAENRLYRIKSLEKKYGSGTIGILKHRQETAAELDAMEEFGLKEEEWAVSAAKAKEGYFAFSAELTHMRSVVKQCLEGQIDKEFLDLAMEKAHFQADIREAEPGPKGLEQVEFLISTNTGEPFLPLVKIASGGELSRVTLAMKRILAASDTCETLIFDEIDSGIGGTTVQSVAEKLASISKDQQVICITHSPIIAAKAGQHLMLEKEELEGRTTTGIHELSGQERVEELTRMLGGGLGSEDLRRHAETLLQGSAGADG
jgi:DNA repair protein RecN (Recombination protein N)